MKGECVLSLDVKVVE